MKVNLSMTIRAHNVMCEIKKDYADQLRKYKKFKARYDYQVDKNGPVAQLYLRHMTQAQDRIKELKSIV